MSFNGNNDQDYNSQGQANVQRNDYYNEDDAFWLAGRDFALSSLIKVALCFQERPKGYKSPFFAFFTAWPKPKGQSQYLKAHKVAFMLELAHMKALAEAIYSRCLPGGFQAGEYKKWADSSKAAVQGDETEQRKGKEAEWREVASVLRTTERRF